MTGIRSGFKLAVGHPIIIRKHTLDNLLYLPLQAAIARPLFGGVRGRRSKLVVTKKPRLCLE